MGRFFFPDIHDMKRADKFCELRDRCRNMTLVTRIMHSFQNMFLF